MTWWRWRRRRGGRPTPDPVPARPATTGNGHAARRALVESRRDLAATRDRVDEYTDQVRKLLGGT